MERDFEHRYTVKSDYGLTKSENLPEQYTERPYVTLRGVNSIKQCLNS